MKTCPDCKKKNIFDFEQRCKKCDKKRRKRDKWVDDEHSIKTV
jgi:hypothetical protein